MKIRRGICLLIVASCVAIAGCGGRAYVYQPLPEKDLRARAETMVDGSVRVTAAVPGREETAAIFGVDLYEQGIQPVWLEIGNSGDSQVRYAPVSTDRYYYSPLEVAYKNRGGISDQGRLDMERRFDELAMPRYVDPGESRAGFVFTHAATGTKAFNVDVFDAGESHHFTFVLGVPGFRPDYADVDFDAIYDADELVRHDDKSIHEALMGLPCCSSNGEGDDRDGAINVVLIGAGTELRLALLRSNWEETSDAASADSTADFFFGRRQDAIFRYQSFVDDSSYELRLWLTPMLHGEDRVWAGQVRHFYRRVTSITRFDPDVDHARYFLMQNMLYGQAIARIGWVSGAEVVPVDSFWTNLFRPPFFTDGYRLVLWLSGDPISVSEAEAIDWDEPPGRADQ